jgi:hypothetical protein
VRGTSRRNHLSYETKKQRKGLRERTPRVMPYKSSDRVFEKDLLGLRHKEEMRETSRKNWRCHETKKQREKFRDRTYFVITQTSSERDFEEETMVF